MLNGYSSYLPNTTIETVVNGQSQLFYGNSNGPSFMNGNYPLVWRHYEFQWNVSWWKFISINRLPCYPWTTKLISRLNAHCDHCCSLPWARSSCPGS